jgi:hypothetical protein
MKNITYFILPLIASLVLIISSCSEIELTTSDAIEDTLELAIDSSALAFEMEDEELIEDRLKLDNGVKWVVNSTTMAVLENMNAKCSDFDGTDHVELGNLLMFQVNDMLENCTINGQGHNQLHVWLLPLIDGINQLQSKDSEDLTGITHLLSVFNDFFESAPEV